MARLQLVFFILTSCFFVGYGDQFLKPVSNERNDHVSEDDIRASFLAEVEGSLGPGSTGSRVRLLEAILRPMYVALPKNEHGNLVHSTVRYALHRLFILRHGWHIRGLDGSPTNSSNSTSPAGVLKDQVPAYIQDIFEKRLGDKGLGLQELAVMAATMEQLIHKETVGKLGEAYGINEILPTEKVNLQQANRLLDTYMAGFVIAQDITMLNAQMMGKFLLRMPELYRSWADTMALVRRIRANITGDPSSFDFSMLARVAEVIGEEFGTFQDIECRQLKSFLMESEFRGTGRVKLTDFYKKGLDTKHGWQFAESTGYLRQLGSLDESSPNDPSIIISNYLNSRSNCIASSGGYYAVCCKDECEGLLGHVEESIAGSVASPRDIIPIIENLPSPTVHRPRTLSASLLKRLEAIASEHGGLVPLHGRLFAQWMHHAYPRECPYPHLSGTTVQMRESEFQQNSGMNAIASEKEMQQLASQASDAKVLAEDQNEDEELLLWSSEEELLVERSVAPAQPKSPFAVLRPLVFLALIGSLIVGFLQHSRAASPSEYLAGNAKFIV